MFEQASSVNKIRALVTAHAEHCLADLLQIGVTPRPEAIIRATGGWTILVAVFPTPSPGELTGLTDCDHDCLALLAQVQEPLSAARIRKELERRSIAIYAEITCKRSLAKLHRLGLVANSRRRPRGYMLPERLPLVQMDL